MVSYFLSQNSFFKVHVFIIQKYVNLNQKVNGRVGQRKFGCIHYFDSFDTLVITMFDHFVLPCDQWFYDELKILFHHLLLLEQKFGWLIPPFTCLLLCCSTLVCGLNVLQFGSIFWRNAQKKRKKSQPGKNYM